MTTTERATTKTKVALRRKLPDISVHINRRGRCTELMFDFICVDGPPPLSEKIERLTDLAADRCFAAGHRRAIVTGSGGVLWDLLVLHTDAQQTLDALAAAALGDSAPLDALIAEWSRNPAPTWEQRRADHAATTGKRS